jgi:hypothetical protein
MMNSYANGDTYDPAYMAARERMLSAPLLLTDSDFAALHAVNPTLVDQAHQLRRLAEPIQATRASATPPLVTKSIEPEAAVDDPVDEFLQRLGIPDVNTDGVTYDGKRFDEAQQRYFDDPKTLTLDDIKLFAVVDVRLGQIARAKQLGYVTTYTEEEQEALKVKVSCKTFYHWVAHWMMPTLATYRYKAKAAQSRLDAFERRLAALESDPLESRIKALESRPMLHYAGVWRPGERYGAGAFLTHGGALWLAEESTSGTPGAPASGFRLVVKSGWAR